MADGGLSYVLIFFFLFFFCPSSLRDIGCNTACASTILDRLVASYMSNTAEDGQDVGDLNFQRHG